MIFARKCPKGLTLSQPVRRQCKSSTCSYSLWFNYRYAADNMHSRNRQTPPLFEEHIKHAQLSSINNGMGAQLPPQHSSSTYIILTEHRIIHFLWHTQHSRYTLKCHQSTAVYVLMLYTVITLCSQSHRQ